MTEAYKPSPSEYRMERAKVWIGMAQTLLLREVEELRKREDVPVEVSENLERAIELNSQSFALCERLLMQFKG